jgi:hypothetical protein
MCTSKNAPNLRASSENPMVALTIEMTPEQRVESEAEVGSLYHEGMVRIVVTPNWAKLIDFETTVLDFVSIRHTIQDCSPSPPRACRSTVRGVTPRYATSKQDRWR